jgi:hypothetical protein
MTKQENLNPNSLESLLGEYYSEAKNLNIEKIKKVPGKFEEKRKEELLKNVRKNDFDLEKTKKLLIFIEQLSGHIVLQEQLYDFISDVVMKHAVMVGREKNDWFSNEQISKMEFNKLFGLKEVNKETPLLDEEKIVGRPTYNENNLLSKEIPRSIKLKPDYAKGNKTPKVQSKLETDIKKARLNVLNIALLWRYRKKIFSFTDFLEQLQLNTYVAHITIRKNKISLDLSRAQTEKEEVRKIIDINNEILSKPPSDKQNNTGNVDEINKSPNKENIKETKEVAKESIRKAEESLETLIKKIEVIEKRSKNNQVFNQELEEKIMPFILSSKQDDINNISNLMKFYDEQNQDTKKLLSAQYETNIKLGSAIKKLNEQIAVHQANEKQHKIVLNDYINSIAELKQKLVKIEQSKIETGISTRDKENTMKGDLNNLLSKEIPKIETAVTAIKMGKASFVEQYLKRLLEQFKSKLNDSLKDK